MATVIEGGCLCGMLRYRLGGPPTPGSVCHCADCRRASAAPMVAWVSIRREHFILLSGELKRIRHAGSVRSFAPCCGTPVLIEDTEDAEHIDVTACSIDQSDWYSPAAAIWVEDRPPWMADTGSLPEFPRAREPS
ncbi:MAG: glutathione-dependent formaldehyde-activating [Verrucomicrobiales bacterium]|nr:glutathione-dependent formaldehyde-activating [Verrucomicrobiales bacterium]